MTANHVEHGIATFPGSPGRGGRRRRAVKREAEEDRAALRTNGTSRIWSNSHFRREACAVFSKRLMRSIVNDAFRSAAAGVDTTSSHSIFDSASQTPPLRMHSAIASAANASPAAQEEWSKRGRR